jgi:hypothetical protein
MQYITAIAACAISTIAFSAAAHQPSDQQTNKMSFLQLAENKCPALDVNLPWHKKVKDELDNNLSKKFRWEYDCVVKLVGQYNAYLDQLQARLHSQKCDPQLTQKNVELWIKENKESYDKNVVYHCSHPLKP